VKFPSLVFLGYGAQKVFGKYRLTAHLRTDTPGYSMPLALKVFGDRGITRPVWRTLLIKTPFPKTERG